MSGCRHAPPSEVHSPVSTLPHKRNNLLLAGALALVGGVVAMAVVITSGRASGVDLTTANLVPADAGIYLAINTNLSSSQWVSAFDLLEQFGVEDPEEELRDAVEEEG